jgi:hypothetical protein
MSVNRSSSAVWPTLPLAEWRDTLDTLHMWTQIVGKVKLALTPFLNEWWNVGFFVTARGLRTGPIPAGIRVFEIEFDFIAHNLIVSTSNGEVKSVPLAARSVASFYSDFMTTLRGLGIDVVIDPLPCEVPNPIRCDINETHASYDPEYVRRWWSVLVQIQTLLDRFRSGFTGKSSPVLFYWGSFDLNHTRFSGHPAEPPAGAPRFLQIAEDQENFSCGFWPGNATFSGVTFGEPALYAYHYPAPAELSKSAVRPSAAYFDATLGEFILRYDDARRAESPDDAVMAFFQSTYKASATAAGWDRGALEPSLTKDRKR